MRVHRNILKRNIVVLYILLSKEGVAKEYPSVSDSTIER